MKLRYVGYRWQGEGVGRKLRMDAPTSGKDKKKSVGIAHTPVSLDEWIESGDVDGNTTSCTSATASDRKAEVGALKANISS